MAEGPSVHGPRFYERMGRLQRVWTKVGEEVLGVVFDPNRKWRGTGSMCSCCFRAVLAYPRPSHAPSRCTTGC